MVKTALFKLLYSPALNPIFLGLNKIVRRLGLTKAQLPPSGIISLSVKEHSFKLDTNQSNYLTKLVYWGGADSFEYSGKFAVLLKKCERFMDIGANIGYFTVLAGVANPDVGIRAFEPAIGPLNYLKRNVELNDLNERVVIEEIALSDRSGSIVFNDVRNPKYTYLKYNLAGEGNIGVEVKNREIIKYEVATITLDEYAKKNNFYPDLIKIDTEGTEHLILGAAKKTIEKARPIIICEILFNRIESKLDEMFYPLDYLFFYDTDQGLQLTDRIKRESDNGVRNCFLVPKEKKLLVQDFVV